MFVCLMCESVNKRRARIRRHRRPCAYYANSCATFHLTLSGELIFKLNPGPVDRSQIPTIVTMRVDTRLENRSARNSRNLRYVQCPGRPLYLSPRGLGPLSLCLLNARSVGNKSAVLMDYLCDCKADLYAKPEIWLTEDDAAVRAELNLDGYNFLDHSRQGRCGGGTGLIFRDSLRVKNVDAGEKSSFEFSKWTVTTVSNCIRLFKIYRPPYSDKRKVPTTVFFREFSDFLESVLLSKEQILFAGDFNIHVDNPRDSDAIKFADLLESVGLQQHVKGSTHKESHTLDHIITRCSEIVLSAPPKVDWFISDHASVCCRLIPEKPPAVEKLVTYRKYRSIDMESFKNDLVTSSLCQPLLTTETPVYGVDQLAKDYNSTLHMLIDCHAPLKSKTAKARPSAPWYAAEIGAVKRLRRKAERRWGKTGRQEDLHAFKV